MIYVLAGNYMAARNHMRDEFPNERERRDWIYITDTSIRGRCWREGDRFFVCRTWADLRETPRKSEIRQHLKVAGISFDNEEHFERCI